MMQVKRVDFIAVPTGDLARSDEFYRKLGLARNPNSSGERWVEYETGNLTIALSQFGGAVAIGVPGVDDARRKLEEQGVQFHGETFDSGVCNGAPFVDPDGNRLLLHRRYAPLEPYDGQPTDVQRVDFVGVNVTDRGRAAEFYGRVLGLDRNELSSEEWPEVEASNVGFVLSTPEQKSEPEFSPYFAIAFRVPDVAESMERLQAGGVEFEYPQVYDSGVCHMAFLKDPDGNALILHHRYTPYADGTMP
jgi:predicted enzyme related to lactoylglutathione lyase